MAVIGTGALGKEHARLYADMHREGLIECVGVYDQNPETAHRVAQQHGLSGLASMEETLERSDALSIVTPTVTHFDIAQRLLRAVDDLLDRELRRPLLVDQGEGRVQQSLHALLGARARGAPPTLGQARDCGEAGGGPVRGPRQGPRWRRQ